MMPLFAETEEQIFGEILRTLVNDTNITRTSPGSKMRSLAEAVSKKMGKMWRQFDRNVALAFLDGAEGEYLNFIGDLLALPRLGAEPARITAQDKTIKFYVDVGTFGDINGGGSITLPTGTIISTGANASGVLYRTVVSSVLISTDSEMYVPAESVRIGDASNIGANELAYHNFTNYTDSVNDTLKVTNEADIFTARDIEIDANYRFRLSQRVVEAQGANPTAIQLTALTVPGVADLVYLPYHRGIGTSDLILKSTTPVITNSLITAVQEAVDQATSAGNTTKVRGPVEVGIALVATLTLNQAVSIDTQTQIINNATNNVINYINSLDIGQELILNQIVERILSTSSVIKNVGSFTKPFDKIFKYQPSSLEDNKVRSKLIADLQPTEDERIITETKYAGATPILIRIG